MAQLPRVTVRATLAQPSEIPAAAVWAERHKVALTYDEDELTLVLVLDGRSERSDDDVELYRITASLDDYNLLPPVWRFVDPRTGGIIGLAAYPKPMGGSSVLHSNGLVCAPWSRLAFQVEGGPHQDWGALTDWKAAAPSSSRALTIPDMLDRLTREVRGSCGRMAALPPLPST